MPFSGNSSRVLSGSFLQCASLRTGTGCGLAPDGLGEYDAVKIATSPDSPGPGSAAAGTWLRSTDAPGSAGVPPAASGYAP